MMILMDMDGVICSEEKTFERAMAKPLPGAREGLQALKDAGHQVVIYTARSWSELAMTQKWLAENKIPYDGLHLGKPVADRIVDDRAIAFTGWPSALESLSKGGKPDVDEAYLKILRLATAEFLKKVAARGDLKGTLLEVGPMTKTGANAPVYERMPESYVDTRALISAKGVKYLSLDMDAAAKPDIADDFMNIEKHCKPGSLDSIVMTSCLEHMPRLFEVPALLEKVLAPGGRAFLLTPWNLRFHGPRPDCWRISDDGYRALFESRFEIESIDKIECPGRPLSPVGMTCVLRKKA